MTTPAPILLASASPRRRQILSRLGLPFAVGVSPIDEEALQDHYFGPPVSTAETKSRRDSVVAVLDKRTPEGLAQWLAEHKAMGTHTLPEAEGHLVITADTTVLLDGQILGKPRDKAHAHELLLALRNRWHHVVTGVCVSQKVGQKVESTQGTLIIQSASISTPVLMRPYSEEEIAEYIASGDPMDKAGSYGIQHPGFQPTERISGCYLNVVGLPLCILVQLLASFDVHPVTEQSLNTPCPWFEKCSIRSEA